MRVVAAEPLPGEQVQGLRSLDEGFVPPVLDPSVLDDRFLVSNRDAVIGLRRLLREEGIFAGLSSGAAIAVALRVAARDGAAASVVVLLADGGWKYLSADLWTRDLDELERRARGLAAVVSEPEHVGLTLPAAVARAMLDHARSELPNEACGLLSGDLATGLAIAYHPARNSEALAAALQRPPRRPGAHHRSRSRTPARTWSPSSTRTRTRRPCPRPPICARRMYPEPFYVLATLADPDATPSTRCAPGGSASGRSTEVSLRIEPAALPGAVGGVRPRRLRVSLLLEEGPAAPAGQHPRPTGT